MWGTEVRKRPRRWNQNPNQDTTQNPERDGDPEQRDGTYHKGLGQTITIHSQLAVN